MAVTGTITTHFKDEDGVDLGKQLIEKDYLITLYPSIFQEFKAAGLFGWGFGGSGKLGINTTANRSSPTQTVSSSNNWTKSATGSDHSIAIKSDGTLWCWGLNTNGQLGDNTVTGKSSPVQTIAFGTNWLTVGGGDFSCHAIKTDGTLWSWGRNTSGQLGDNTVVHRSSPVQTVAFGTNWKQVAGGITTAAIKTDGTLWCWGFNGQGQIGNNAVANRSSPVQTVTFATNWAQVDVGYRHVCAVKTDGTLWCWGESSNGRLGNDNSVTDRSSPVQTVTFSNDWKQVSAGGAFTAGIKNDGSLWTWGLNTNGQLGDNTIVHRSSPVQTVAYGNNWKQVSCCWNFAIASKTDGTLWSWGANNVGQLGDATVTQRSSPVQVFGGLKTWKNIGELNSTNGADHAFAILDFEY